MSAADAVSKLPEGVRGRGRIRPALIAAGLKLLAERPIDSLSVDEIVEVAGVAKGSFFYHFADKRAFAREIAAAVRAEVEATITEANRGIEDPACRVARGIGQFVRFALVAPDKATIVVTADLRGADPDHALNAGLRSDLARGMETGRFEGDDVTAAMLNLIGITHLLIRKVVFDRPDGVEARALFGSVLSFAFRGLGLSAVDARSVLDRVAADLFDGTVSHDPAIRP
jgi:AcrR family transcriptional regulator